MVKLYPCDKDFYIGWVLFLTAKQATSDAARDLKLSQKISGVKKAAENGGHTNPMVKHSTIIEL